MDFLFKEFETNTLSYSIMTAIISLLFGILSKFITERFVKKKSEKSETPTIQIKNNSDNTYFSNNTINSNNTTNINTHYHSPTTNSSDNSGSDIIAYILLFGVGLGMGIVFFARYSSIIILGNSILFSIFIGIYIALYKRNHGTLPSKSTYVTLCVYFFTMIIFVYWWNQLSSIHSAIVAVSYNPQIILPEMLKNPAYLKEVVITFASIVILGIYSINLFFLLKHELSHSSKSSKMNILSPVYCEFIIIAFYIFFNFIINLFYNKSA